jgi:hypothetical protein
VREQWRAIPGCLLHEVSNKGRVRALPGALINKQAVCKITLRSTKPDACGYPRVTVCGRIRHVHVLVLTVWHRPRRKGEECRHLNGNPADNRYPENIVWGTRAENRQDLLGTGWKQRKWKYPAESVRWGNANHATKLTEKQVAAIRAADGSWGFRTRLAKKYGVSGATITMIRQGKRRTYPTQP